MAKRNILERDLYENVRGYLTKKQGCVTASFNSKGVMVPFVNRGYGQLIVDVYGLRGISDVRSRRIEGLAVEVKRARTSTSRRSIAQAEQYSYLAHRCYLAQPFDFTDKAKSEAARAGIGLLLIEKSGVKLISESRLFVPVADAFESFLNRSLRISRCAVCGCYQFRYAHFADGSNSGEGHWRRDHIAPDPLRKNKLTFLCAECESHWTPASDFRKLSQQVGRLSKKVARLQRALKQ